VRRAGTLTATTLARAERSAGEDTLADPDRDAIRSGSEELRG